MDLEPAFNRVATELLAFFDGARSITSTEEDSISTRSKMQMMGFSKKSISNLISDTDQSIDIYGAIKQFSKIIVQGKNRDFDASQVILVCGPEKSGKTVLSQKLAKFLPTKLPVQSNKVIADTLTGDLTSLFKSDLESNITSLFRKRQDVDLDSGRLIIDYEGSLDILSAVLDKFDRLEQKPNVSVVYALEVGKSYNAVKKSLESFQIPNLFIAFTKMDLLEVSVSELSAVSDLDQKIQFFSGLKISEDGLDFAKVSVVEDFLGNLAKQEGL
jgi:energy-coupling factor transporter ATP-binding protein EcfA2